MSCSLAIRKAALQLLRLVGGALWLMAAFEVW
jgi:hypothetical protein